MFLSQCHEVARSGQVALMLKCGATLWRMEGFSVKRKLWLKSLADGKASRLEPISVRLPATSSTSVTLTIDIRHR